MASVTEPTRREPAIPAKPTVTNFPATKSLTNEIPANASPHFPIDSGSDSPHSITDEPTDEDSVARRLVILGTVLFPLAGLISAILIASQYGMVRWLDIVMLVGGWYLTGMGITIGYHRMLTHRSFETVSAVRGFWTAMGALAVEGSPIDWCMVHRKHHQFSDHEGDPHSPHLHDGGMLNQLKGFWHSHTGWLFNSNWSKGEREKYVPDLLEDKMLVAIDNHYVSWVTASLLIPAAIGRSRNTSDSRVLNYKYRCWRRTRITVGWVGTRLRIPSYYLVNQLNLPHFWFARLQIVRRLSKQYFLWFCQPWGRLA